MSEKSSRTERDRSGEERERYSTQGRQVRMVILTWPLFAVLGATAATATCLFNECDRDKIPAATETLIGNVGAVKSIAIRPDGGMLSSIGVGGSMLVVDLKERPRYPYLSAGSGRVRCATFSPDNRLLATGNPDAAVTLYGLVDGEVKTLDDPDGESAGAACLAFSPDGATLAVGQQNGQVTLWDTTARRKRSTMEGHKGFVASLAFAPDGKGLASAGGDRVARIWDLTTRRQRYQITSPENTFVAMAFSRDGRLLFLGDQVSPFVREWDMASGVEAARLRGPKGAVVAVGISPDGSTLAAADYQGFVTFWDLATKRVRPGRLTHAGVRTLAYASDGLALVTGGFDGVIRFWDVSDASDL